MLKNTLSLLNVYVFLKNLEMVKVIKIRTRIVLPLNPLCKRVSTISKTNEKKNRKSTHK